MFTTAGSVAADAVGASAVRGDRVDTDPVSGDPVAELLTAFAESTLARRRAAAVQLRALDEYRRAALDRLGDVRDFGVSERSVRLEASLEVGMTEHEGERLFAVAEALVHRFPSVWLSLHAGRISERRAFSFVELLDPVEEHLVAELAERGLELAETLPDGSFRRAFRRLVEAARVETLQQRHEVALTHRRVSVDPVGNGMAWFAALMPEVEARGAFGRVTAMAKKLVGREGDERSLDQARADVVGDLLVDGDSRALLPEARGVRATVHVTVPALSLRERAEADAGRSGTDAGHAGAEAGHAEVESGHAEVEGMGPIPLSRARELAGGASGWTRILTHPETGVALSVGRTQYKPPESLRRLVQWRSGRCMAPGCHVPAARCEIDHTVAWEHGGGTSADNLASLCKGHHTVKHHGGWAVDQVHGDGTLRWTSPAGRIYTVAPERRTPFFRPQ